MALLFALGAAAPAQANDGPAGAPTAIAAPQSGAVPGSERFPQETETPVRLTGASTDASLFLWGVASQGVRRELVRPTMGLAALPPERRPAPALRWASQTKSALALPVTERLSLALDYRRLEGEDLWHRHAEAGSLDYDSHDFLVRARWRF
jgi:hypothetical protein